MFNKMEQILFEFSYSAKKKALPYTLINMYEISYNLTLV